MLREAGLLRLYQPRRFGGLEMPYGRMQVDIASVLGAVSASLAWVQSGLSVHGWIVGNFPREAQEAVWGGKPDALVATGFTDTGGRAREVDGGLLLDGTWHFSSACSVSDWVIVRVSVAAQGQPPRLTLCLVPRGDLAIEDVWDPVGLRGTGSNNVVLRECFVPRERTIELLSLRGGAAPPDPEASFLYRLPFMSLFPFAVAVPALGVARGALDAYRRDVTASPEKSSQVTRQIRFAEAAARIDCAALLLKSTGQEIEDALAARRVLGTHDKIGGKRNYAFAVRLCRDAVGALVQDLGARGIENSHPVQRAWRDVLAISSHFGVNWDVSGEYFGREAFGLPPTDPMA
ncbi:MAG TPA: acyl-CoA dehydrogenase family protein [Burkholderiaceae bacterium]|nr:acyl-CoA dehydrogenase family protein [Burkholderiaceae bacterium]